MVLLQLLMAFVAFAVPAQGTANTANVEVTVIPAPVVGQPPPTREGFTVCIGTTADRDQYGLQATPAAGVANQAFRNLPTGASVVITVAKAGYVGWESTRTLAAGWSNHVQAQVQPGSGGPTCGVPPTAPYLQPTATGTINVSPPTPNATPPSIMAMNINSGVTHVTMDDQLRLYYRLAGPAPTEMRVSETSGQFPEPWAVWTPFVPHPGGPVQGMDYVFHQAPNRKLQTEAPRKTLYLQFRREGRVSNIGTASVDVLKKYAISGGAAYEEAKRQGFVFLITGWALIPASSCSMGKNYASGNLEFSTPGGISITGHCTFDIFSGRTLKAPWTLDNLKFDKRFSYTCDPVVFRSSTSPSSLASSVHVPFVNVGSIAVAGCAYELTTVTLVGPAATPWQNAFAK